MVRTLLILDSLRGQDSTGIAAIDKTEEVRIAKAIGHPFNLFDTKKYDAAMCKLNRAIIGHNRYATQGGVTLKNAHPFDFESIVGVHNGTLVNKHKLLDATHYAVDSENLYWHLEQRGLDDLLTVMDGAWSLVWWNKYEETLNFLRNDQRPMYIAFSDNDELMLWASEHWMLEVAIGRESIKFGDIVSTKADQHYSFQINSERVISKPHVRHTPSKIIKPVYVNSGNFHSGQQAKTGVSSLPVVQTQQSNVVVLSKKERVTPQTVKTVDYSTNLYSGRKDVLLETLHLKTDKRGAKYLVCFDPENRGANIRLYINSKDNIDNLLLKDIKCSLGRKIIDAFEGIYFKVDHGSVKLAGVSAPQESAGKFFADARGNLIPRKVWLDTHSKGCCWCTSHVFPEDNYRFTDTKEILCNDCASDSEINQYVTLQ